MKKRLLLMMVIALTASSVYALNVGDYVFTRNARYKIMGSNLVLNGQFADAYDNWETADSASVADAFSIEPNVGPEGQNVASGTAAAAGQYNMGIYQKVTGVPGTLYVATFKVKTVAGASSSSVWGKVPYINFYTNASGEVNDTTTVKDESGTWLGGYLTGAESASITPEWQIFAYALLLPEDQSAMFIEFAGLPEGTQITDIEISEAVEVYDIRKAKKVLDYAKFLLDIPEFVESREDLQEVYDEAMEQYNDNEGGNEDMTDILDILQEMINEFINANTEDYYTFYYPLDDSGKNNSSPDWTKWTNSYNRGGLINFNGWTFTGGNWGSRVDLDGDGKPDTNVGRPIWDGSLGYGNDFPERSEMYRSDKLPVGKYLLQVQSYGGRMSGYGSTGLSYVINLADSCMRLRMYVGNDTTEYHTLPTGDYNTYSTFMTVANANVPQKYGFEVTDVGTLSYGGQVYFHNPKLLRIKGTYGDDFSLEEYKWIDNVKSNLKDLNSQLTTAENYLADTAYPWRKDSLQMGYDVYKPMYDAWAALTDREIVEQGAGLSDSIYNNATRIMREYYNKPFAEDNAPVLALKIELDDANATINDPGNAKGDKVSYQLAIDLAQAAYDKCFTVPNKTVEDSLACREQVQALIQAKMEFKNSIAGKANPSEIHIVNGNFASTTGTKASFQAEGWNVISEDSNGGWTASYWWGHSSSDPDADKYHCIAFNRGTGAYPKNKVQQTVTLTSAGYYTFAFQGYAYNCVEATDQKAGVKHMEWDPDWEEWVQTDSIEYYIGAEAFFGPDGAPDSIHVHKDPKAPNLNGASLYGDGKNEGSTPHIYACPPDYYQLTIYKESSEPETYEIGFSTLNNIAFCDGGFGDAHIYYTKDEEPNYPVVSEKTALLGDANDDGQVNVNDITAIASFILTGSAEPWNEVNADANGDGIVNVNDITATATIILTAAKAEVIE